MNKKYKQSSSNLGLVSLIIGICAIALLFFIPVAALPLLILAIIFSVIQMRNGFNLHAKIGLALGILTLILYVVIAFVAVDIDLYLPNAVNPNGAICEGLGEVECLELPESCQLCAREITSSYVGCHSVEFCDNGEYDVEIMALEYVMSMSEFVDYDGRDLEMTGFWEARCIGCYNVELEFLMDSMKDPSEVDMVSVTVIFNDWEIVDVISSAGVVSDETAEENELVLSDDVVVEKVIALPENVMSVEECGDVGGEVFNTLGVQGYSGELVGRIDGLMCPCACLVA